MKPKGGVNMKKWLELGLAVSAGTCWGTMPPSSVSMWVPGIAFWVSVIFLVAWKIVQYENKNKEN